ncbi:MAG: RluA family pseudouridine synthase [Oscillospiraceae bacterium]|nr:RluA family pseudouridine synthase [Oscillospiraceae bacterium]
MLQITVTPEQAGHRLDQFLSEFLPDKTRSAIQKMIEDGLVTADGKKAAKNLKLKAGVTVTVEEPEPEELELQPEDIPLPVVYEDDDLLVVNKPKGMVVHPAPGNYSGTMVNALLFHCKDSLSGINGVIRPGIVHRIDKDTSGLLIVAKNDRAHQGLAEQIHEHSFDRIYEAVVYGNVKADTGTVRAWIGRHPQDRKKMAIHADNAPGARDAVTHYEVIARYPGFTHIRCRLETGRTHQIRVHMASIGHPVAGDPVYGPKKVLTQLNGQCLHARSIAFTHPVTGKRISCDSVLPPEFRTFLRKLRSEAGGSAKPLSGLLLAVDCDGTILRNDKTLSARSIDAVRRFRALGGAFTIATGRSVPAAMPVLNALDVDMPVVLYNGAMVYDPTDSSILWEIGLPEQTKALPEKLLAAFPGVALEVLTADGINVITMNKTLEEHFAKLPDVAYLRRQLSDVIHQNWTKIVMAYPTEQMPELIGWLESLGLEGVMMTHSDHYLFEILPASAGKERALRRLCDFAGFPMNKVIAMGDYYNDVGMIRAAGFGAAPESACDEARAAADLITASNEKDAVAELIDYIIAHPHIL